MKKLFTIMALALCSLASIADEYTCPYKVLVTGLNPVTGEMTVNVDKQSNNKYTLSIKNFALNAAMKVGNIVVNDVDGLICGNTTALSTQQVIQITSGDGNAEDWMGPTLGDVPILMKAEICNNKLNAILNIDMSKMQQNVRVMLGENVDDFGQIPNSDFGDFHDVTYKDATSREPNHWHSFMSASGSYVSYVAGTPHTFESTDHPTNSKNGKSVQIKSANVAEQSANGTLTTGRLNAGSISAANTANNAFLNLENTDLDANNDPFYTVLTCNPDSIKVNLKYTIGKRSVLNKKHKNATVKAIITNGNEVQDPELDDNKGNVVARAENAKIESSNNWQELPIAFNYTDNEISTKAILVTISTSSVAAGGSKDNTDPDIVWVDNVELVYNADLESVTYKGEPIEFEDGEALIEGTGVVNLDDFVVKAKSPHAFISKTITPYNNEGVFVAVTVTSNDLKTANVYYILIEGATTSIKDTKATIANNGIQAIYNLAGQQVGSMTPGQVYIVKTTDGQTKKVIKK